MLVAIIGSTTPPGRLRRAVAEALDRAGPLSDERRTRTGVFVGLGLDLNTTNFHFRWSVLAKTKEWARQLGIADADFPAWERALLDAAGPPLSANRTMGALGSIACLLTLMGVPGMNWFLVATLATGAVFGLTLAYIRRR